MPKKAAIEAEIAALRDAGDVTGLITAYGATKRRDRRGAVLAALTAMGAEGRDALIALLGDEAWHRQAGGLLVELGEDEFPRIAALLESGDEAQRRGALHTVYLYARYRDLPAAHQVLRSTAGTDTAAADLAGPAAKMLEKVELVVRERNTQIDEALAKIQKSLDQEKVDGGATIVRMYSRVHSGRMEARGAIAGMRYAGVRHVIASAPQYGEVVVGVLLALGLSDLGGGLIPLIEDALHTADTKTRGLLLTALVCLRRARIAGAAEALERDGSPVTDAMDRRAARIYKAWVREG